MSVVPQSTSHHPLSRRLAARGIDGVLLLTLPAALFLLAVFVYPFLYGLVLSFQPRVGDMLANYQRFFNERFFWATIPITLWLSLPVTILNLVLAVPLALRVRLMERQRLITTILVLPVTLGTVLVAEGLLNFLGPQGWFTRTTMLLNLTTTPVKLVHNYWGVFISLVITGFPFTFLLTLSHVSGIDPSLEKAAASLGAGGFARFVTVLLPLLVPGLAITFCLSFVQAFSVFPSAVMLGAPAGPTRVISIAAYQAAFEEYDAPMASAVAMVMGAVEMMVVVAVLAARNLVYRGPAGGGKG